MYSSANRGYKIKRNINLVKLLFLEKKDKHVIFCNNAIKLSEKSTCKFDLILRSTFLPSC